MKKTRCLVLGEGYPVNLGGWIGLVTNPVMDSRLKKLRGGQMNAGQKIRLVAEFIGGKVGV